MNTVMESNTYPLFSDESLDSLTKCGIDIQKHINTIRKRHNAILENALRTNAVPPIKGEITRGKVKWRGIRLCHRNNMFCHEKWLEQRGKQISPLIRIESIINYPESK